MQIIKEYNHEEFSKWVHENPNEIEHNYEICFGSGKPKILYPAPLADDVVKWVKSKLTQPQQTVSNEEIDKEMNENCNLHVLQGFLGTDETPMEKAKAIEAEGFLRCAKWMRDKLQSQTNEGELIEFATWYSGMDVEKVKRAYERYKREALQNTNKDG